MPLSVGSTAPDFTLKRKVDGKLIDVNLAQELSQGPVVLLFVPAAFTSVCTAQLCDTGLDEIRSANLFGISVDSPFAQEAWARSAGVRIPLLSDFQHQVTKAYDVVLPDLVGIGPASQRAVFVIDKDGIIRHAEQTASPRDLPNMAAVEEVLAGLN